MGQPSLIQTHAYHSKTIQQIPSTWVTIMRALVHLHVGWHASRTHVGRGIYHLRLHAHGRMRGMCVRVRRGVGVPHHHRSRTADGGAHRAGHHSRMVVRRLTHRQRHGSLRNASNRLRSNRWSTRSRMRNCRWHRGRWHSRCSGGRSNDAGGRIGSRHRFFDALLSDFRLWRCCWRIVDEVFRR